METTTYTKFKQHLKSFLDKVITNDSPLLVTCPNNMDVVVMSRTDYNSMQETFYLMKSPKNAARLLKGINEYEKG
jgi:antitoxin YefM